MYVWERGGRKLVTERALILTSGVGMLVGGNSSRVGNEVHEGNSIEISVKPTHDIIFLRNYLIFCKTNYIDLRCTASCVVVLWTIFKLLDYIFYLDLHPLSVPTIKGTNADNCLVIMFFEAPRMEKIVGEDVDNDREILVEEEENLGPEISDKSGENASPVNLILPLLTAYFDNHTEPVLK